MFKKSDFLDENFYKIIDQLSVNVYWKDTEGRYLGCNQCALGKFGLKSFKETIGKNDYEILFISKEEIAQFIENDKYALKHGIFEGEEYATVNGEKLTFQSKKISFLNEKGEVAGIMATSLDITNQKKLLKLEKEKILLEERLKIAQIIDSVNASIYWKDQHAQKYLGCNRRVLDMFGMKNRDEFLGKTNYDLMSDEDAQRINRIDEIALASGSYEGEERIKLSNGEEKIYYTIKNQLTDSTGKVIGLVGTSLDITAQKEVERLRLESETQKVTLQEKENFAQLARKVAHDISSPLTALKMMLPQCNELPEDKRMFLNRATESIWDIANNLLNSFHKQKNATTSKLEPRQPLLVSDLLIQLLSEKKVQYQDQSVTLNTIIAHDAQFAFIQCQATEFRRALSNLINNAVDALKDKADGKVTIQLDVNAGVVVIEVTDNGCGMPSVMKEKIRRHQSFTTGKEDGHGLGLQQVWDTLEYNEGVMEVESVPRKGTTIKLAFAIAKTASWIAQAIHLIPNSIIVILDDDESIHGAWNLRFITFLTSYPDLRIHHFTQGQEVLDFLKSLSHQEKECVVFLSDYELLYQNRNGLQIIEAGAIVDSILVTSYYSNPQVQEAASQLKVKILPKQMASVIPIYMDADNLPTTLVCNSGG